MRESVRLRHHRRTSAVGVAIAPKATRLPRTSPISTIRPKTTIPLLLDSSSRLARAPATAATRVKALTLSTSVPTVSPVSSIGRDLDAPRELGSASVANATRVSSTTSMLAPISLALVPALPSCVAASTIQRVGGMRTTTGMAVAMRTLASNFQI